MNRSIGFRNQVSLLTSGAEGRLTGRKDHNPESALAERAVNATMKARITIDRTGFSI
jgi:hypothetical protein